MGVNMTFTKSQIWEETNKNVFKIVFFFYILLLILLLCELL